MPFNVRLAAVALDCVDPTALAEFYRDFASGEIVFTTEEFVAVSAAGFYLAAVRVPDHRPPTWPEADLPKQMHLDFAVDNLDAAQARAIELGGHRGRHPAGARPLAGAAGPGGTPVLRDRGDPGLGG